MRKRKKSKERSRRRKSILRKRALWMNSNFVGTAMRDANSNIGELTRNFVFR